MRGRRLRVWGHQVLAVSPNKKKCQPSAPGGCAGSSPPPCLQPHALSILPLIHISILLRQLLSSPPLSPFPQIAP